MFEERSRDVPGVTATIMLLVTSPSASRALKFKVYSTPDWPLEGVNVNILVAWSTAAPAGRLGSVYVIGLFSGSVALTLRVSV